MRLMGFSNVHSMITSRVDAILLANFIKYRGIIFEGPRNQTAFCHPDFFILLITQGSGQDLYHDRQPDFYQ